MYGLSFSFYKQKEREKVLPLQSNTVLYSYTAGEGKNLIAQAAANGEADRYE